MILPIHRRLVPKAKFSELWFSFLFKLVWRPFDRSASVKSENKRPTEGNFINGKSKRTKVAINRFSVKVLNKTLACSPLISDQAQLANLIKLEPLSKFLFDQVIKRFKRISNGLFLQKFNGFLTQSRARQESSAHSQQRITFKLLQRVTSQREPELSARERENDQRSSPQLQVSPFSDLSFCWRWGDFTVRQLQITNLVAARSS